MSPTLSREMQAMTHNLAFEHGADAMLEALLRGPNVITFGVQAAADPTQVRVALPNEPGVWVLIPLEMETKA